MCASDENGESTSTAEDRLDGIRKVRGGQRGAVTKMIKLANEEIQQNKGNLNVEVLARTNSIRIQLKEKRRIMELWDDKVLEKCPTTDIDKEIDDAMEVSTLIIETITKIEDFALGKYSTQREQGNIEAPNVSTPTRDKQRKQIHIEASNI